MKRIFLCLMLVTLIIYSAEANDRVGLNSYKPELEVSHMPNQFVISWPKLPYPAYYEVEILNRSASGLDSQSAHRILSYRTLKNVITIDESFPDSAYLRVSAHSLFHHPLGMYSDALGILQMKAAQAEEIKPTVKSRYPAKAPAGNMPLLTWTVVPSAVFYEIEFLHSLPETPNNTEPSQSRLFSSREVFTNGFTINLADFNGNLLYWRVRALDYGGNAIGVFSDAEELYIDHKQMQVIKPVSNTGYRAAGMPMPLYPVYAWIPLAGASQYEIEVTSAPPENPNSVEPSVYRIQKLKVGPVFDCYDEKPYISPGTYYWRVRGLDEDGNPFGVYSDAEPFVVDLSTGEYAATFGDSITHGGGAVSYSPADIEYDYQAYLSFPAANLGKSGDTSEAMLNRFHTDVLPYHPKYLLIMGGTNSLRGGIPAEQVIAELRSIRERCLQNGIRPIFLTLPPVNPANIYKVFNEETAPQWQQEFAKVNDFIRKQRYYIDLEPYFVNTEQELPTYYAVDGLHLDVEGKKLMAQIINANWERVTQ